MVDENSRLNALIDRAVANPSSANQVVDAINLIYGQDVAHSAISRLRTLIPDKLCKINDLLVDYSTNPVQQSIPQQQVAMMQQEPVQPVAQQQNVPPPSTANDLPVKTRHFLEGDKVPIGDVVDHNLVVKDYRQMKSKYRHGTTKATCVMYQFSFVESREQNINELKNHVFISGSNILESQIKEYSDRLPFYTMLKHVNNKYFSFGPAEFT